MNYELYYTEVFRKMQAIFAIFPNEETQSRINYPPLTATFSAPDEFSMQTACILTLYLRHFTKASGPFQCPSTTFRIHMSAIYGMLSFGVSSDPCCLHLKNRRFTAAECSVFPKRNSRQNFRSAGCFFISGPAHPRCAEALHRSGPRRDPGRRRRWRPRRCIPAPPCDQRHWPWSCR